MYFIVCVVQKRFEAGIMNTHYVKKASTIIRFCCGMYMQIHGNLRTSFWLVFSSLLLLQTVSAQLDTIDLLGAFNCLD